MAYDLPGPDEPITPEQMASWIVSALVGWDKIGTIYVSCVAFRHRRLVMRDKLPLEQAYLETARIKERLREAVAKVLEEELAMAHTCTHSYAVLEISPAAFEEIRRKLQAAGYQDQLHNRAGRLVIDMTGIAVTSRAQPVSHCGMTNHAADCDCGGVAGDR